MDKIKHPLMDEEISFLKTSKQTNGEVTLLEVLLGPKGGNPLHFHRRFTESFSVLEGALNIQVENSRMLLKAGDTATIPIGTRHRFYNESGAPVRFICELKPGSEGFENVLRIVCGLHADGMTNSHGFPKSFIQNGILMNMGEGYAVGLFSILERFLRIAGKTKKAKRIEKQLIEKYCK